MTMHDAADEALTAWDRAEAVLNECECNHDVGEPGTCLPCLFEAAMLDERARAERAEAESERRGRILDRLLRAFEGYAIQRHAFEKRVRQEDPSEWPVDLRVQRRPPADAGVGITPDAARRMLRELDGWDH